ncbi:hypothetical protein MUK42_10468 [Musa troglodytarum]|uniref:Uncharacterized protein n=1 Tax=Musa troglodytarum TaxID=320322 RepID=A0A9E7F6R3_9LILI|nr:hypothetical protein MUK42_10468 [Musa troglodytarum]
MGPKDSSGPDTVSYSVHVSHHHHYTASPLTAHSPAVCLRYQSELYTLLCIALFRRTPLLLASWFTVTKLN